MPNLFYVVDIAGKHIILGEEQRDMLNEHLIALDLKVCEGDIPRDQLTLHQEELLQVFLAMKELLS